MKQSILFQRFFCFCLGVLSCQLYAQSSDTSTQVVDLSMTEVLKRIEKQSSQYKLSELETQIVKNNIEFLNGAYDTRLNVQLGYRVDASDPVNAVFGTRNDSLSYTSNIQKNFKYGTALELGFTGSSQSSNSPFVALDPAIDNQWYLRLRQSLWSNGFGQNIIKKIQSLQHQVQGTIFMATRKKEILLASVLLHEIQLDYTENEKSILLQAHQRALDLYQNTKKRKGMGVANTTDVLASEANALAREQNVKQASLNYEKTCSDILSILEYDVARFTCQTDIQFSTRLTKILNNQNPVERLDYQKLETDLLANQLLIEARKNNLNPDVNLILELASNGVNDAWTSSFSESLELSHPNFFAGVEITIPLQNKQSKSELKRAKLTKEQLKLQLKDLKNNIEKEYYQAQKNLMSYQEQLSLSKQQVEVEKKKLHQKNQDFKIGRAEIADVILYQQDVLNAELTVKRNETQVYLAMINQNLAKGSLFFNIQNMDKGIK